MCHHSVRPAPGKTAIQGRIISAAAANDLVTGIEVNIRSRKRMADGHGLIPSCGKTRLASRPLSRAVRRQRAAGRITK